MYVRIIDSVEGNSLNDEILQLMISHLGKHYQPKCKTIVNVW